MVLHALVIWRTLGFALTVNGSGHGYAPSIPNWESQAAISVPIQYDGGIPKFVERGQIYNVKEWPHLLLSGP